MHAPSAKSKASVSICISLLLLNVISVRGLMHACLNNLNALSCSLPYLKGVSLRVSFVSSKAFFK